jgi:SNF2 family DNA or RNA helicase
LFPQITTSNFRFLVYERPISAANSKSAKWEQRARGHAQSQTLDKITKTFMLRRLQKDILKSLLPPRKELLLFCRPSECQRELYKRIAGSAMSSLGATTDALTVLTNLRKLCCHPSLLEKNNQGASDVALSGKLKVLDTLLQATKQCNPDDKVVIVSNFTSVLSTIEETIFKARKWPYVRLDGTVAQSDRQPLVDSFNRCSPDKAFAFLLSSKAGGCGLNLIGGEFRNCCG